MDRYKRFSGLIVFVIAVILMIFVAMSIIKPQYNDYNTNRDNVEQVQKTLEEKRLAKETIARKLKRLRESVMSSQKKIYSPVEENLENDTLFFTLYSDLIEMVHNNTIKIKSIDYEYNPKGDIFVAQNNSIYFVCDVNMEVVSNYVNLGKLIQDIYQYPYYIKINNIDVIPYPKDKKILLAKLSMRLYAHTSPDSIYGTDESATGDDAAASTEQPIDGAQVPIPQE